MPFDIRGAARLMSGADLNQPRVTVAVQGKLARQPTVFFIDTGCQLSVVGGELAQQILPQAGEALRRGRISTRLGLFEGDVHRLEVTLLSESTQGNHLTFDANFLLLPDWKGPSIVLGYPDALDRICVALCPGQTPDEESWFYFGLGA